MHPGVHAAHGEDAATRTFSMSSMVANSTNTLPLKVFVVKWRRRRTQLTGACLAKYSVTASMVESMGKGRAYSERESIRGDSSASATSACRSASTHQTNGVALNGWMQNGGQSRVVARWIPRAAKVFGKGGGQAACTDAWLHQAGAGAEPCRPAQRAHPQATYGLATKARLILADLHHSAAGQRVGNCGDGGGGDLLWVAVLAQLHAQQRIHPAARICACIVTQCA